MTALLGDLTWGGRQLPGQPLHGPARLCRQLYARTLIDVGAITRSLKKEYEHLAQKKEMDWDAHFNNLTTLVRAAGVGGSFSRSPSAVLSVYGALSLSAASGANLSRTCKDLLAALFAPPKKKKRKERKSTGILREED